MRVLLCLVSEQHVPNLLTVHHFTPDRLILIRSGLMAKQAEFFLDALAISQYPKERVDIIALEDENNLTSVRHALHRAFGKFPEAQWIGNVTGGIKPMSIAAFEFFKALGARVVYVDLRKPNEILGLDGQPTEVCAYRLSLEEFLAGYGFQIAKDWQKIAEGEERARQWWPLAHTIAAHAPNQNLIRVGDGKEGRDEWKAARHNGITLAPRHTKHLPTEVRAAIIDNWRLAELEQAVIGAIDKYQAKFLTGGWLEVFCWKLLAENAEELNLDHVHLEVEARKKDTQAPTDIDVAFLSNQSLGAIECKSGEQDHSDDPNQPLDKLEARIQQFRALRVSPILATTSGQILDGSGAVRPTFAQRAQIYNCRIVTVHQIRQLATSSRTSKVVRELLLGDVRGNS